MGEVARRVNLKKLRNGGKNAVRELKFEVFSSWVSHSKHAPKQVPIVNGTKRWGLPAT